MDLEAQRFTEGKGTKCHTFITMVPEFQKGDWKHLKAISLDIHNSDGDFIN